MAAKGGKRTLFARAVNLPNAAPPIEYETDVRTKCVLGHVSDMNFCFRVGWHGVPMTSEIDSPFAFLPPDPNFVAIESLPAHPAMREGFENKRQILPFDLGDQGRLRPVVFFGWCARCQGGSRECREKVSCHHFVRLVDFGMSAMGRKRTFSRSQSNYR